VKYEPPEAVRIAWRDNNGVIVVKTVDPHTQTDYLLVPFSQWLIARADQALWLAIKERAREIERMP
jgi:hypothetical protein